MSLCHLMTWGFLLISISGTRSTLQDSHCSTTVSGLTSLFSSIQSSRSHTKFSPCAMERYVTCIFSASVTALQAIFYCFLFNQGDLMNFPALALLEESYVFNCTICLLVSTLLIFKFLTPFPKFGIFVSFGDNYVEFGF